MGRAHGRGAVGQPVDPHDRLAAAGNEVPVSLDAAAGGRSLRPPHHLLRLPGHLQDVRRRADVAGDQSRPLDAGPEPHRLVGRHRAGQPRPVLRRGRLRDRPLVHPARADLGGHERRQALVHEGRRRSLDRRDEEHSRPADLGHRAPDCSLDVRARRGLRHHRSPPDGRQRAVHLQDHRFRPDLDEDQQQPADRRRARLRHVSGREPQPARHAVRRHRPCLLLLDGRWGALDAVQAGTAGGAGQLDRRPEGLSRRRRVDLRARPVHPEGHHAPRAGRQGADRRRAVPL